jgi:hypothetical protein
VVDLLVEASDLLNDPIQRTRGWMENQQGKKVRFAADWIPFEIEPGSSGVVPLRVEIGSASVATVRRLEIDTPGDVDRWIVEER